MIADTLLKVFVKDPTIKRHLLKTISWRLIGSIDTFFLGWIITGQINIGAKIGGMELITKMILYFMHERVWHKISFGNPTRLAKAEKIKSENASNLFVQPMVISRPQREELNEHKSFTIWLTGLSGAGKSSIAAELDRWFYGRGLRSYVIDGDNTRLGINSDLSFTNEDRSENIRRVAELCKLFNDAGTIVIASFISPFEKDRTIAKDIIGKRSLLEVFVDASIKTCKARDVKGLYKLAEEGKIKNFTGISSPYEIPFSSDIHLRTDTESIDNCIAIIIKHLTTNNIIKSQSLSQPI